MQKRLLIIGTVVIPLVAVALIGAFLVRAWMNEYARNQEADRAFAPIEKLGLCVFSNPIFSCRYCTYCIVFEETTRLNDENISQLSTMNELSQENDVMLCINTRNVTDASLPFLKTLSTLDDLDVTATGISHAGLKELASALPDCSVKFRTKAAEAPEQESQQVDPPVAAQSLSETEPYTGH